MLNFVVVLVMCLALANSFAPQSFIVRKPVYQLYATTLSSTQAEFSLKGYLSRLTPLIEDRLKECLSHQDTPETAKITEAMYYSLLAGGKRVRPVAACLAYDYIKGSPPVDASVEQLKEHYRDVLSLGVSIEMIHTMSLIHDDLPAMDDDDYRRGRLTCHKVYGEDVAILAGDSLLSSSFEYLVREGKGTVEPLRLLEVLERLSASVGNLGLAGGQVMDLECEGKPSKEVTLDDLRWIHKHKTGALLNIAVAGGAILGGADSSTVTDLEVYADKIGLAFQVADDILDCTATSEELGKTAGKDEAVDKATYVRLMGLDGARDEARRLRDEAIETLGEGGEGLSALADFIVSRGN